MGHGLRTCDPAMQGAVREVDEQLQQLAPALDAPAWAVPLGPGLDATVRANRGAIYVIAMIDRATDPGARTIQLPPTMRGWQISCPYENRTLSRTGPDAFTDTFPQESTYHIYRITP
jgi:hypothetical protein